ncbi:MAG: hypothetical protein HYZ84_07095 [Candidatus Omnitrophica bacterium]|nr:hypothetical protein [Candidatus Omnitrophota bacterium]
MLKKYIVFGLMLMAVLSPCSQAETPDAIKMQANNDVQVASRLSEQAMNMLQGEMNREKLQTAMGLYIQAGQLFEKAMNAYKNLGPQYATPQDVENSYNAMQHCIKMIDEIKKRL